MDISGKGWVHFYQETSSLIGNQTYHRTNMFSPHWSNSCYESDYECIFIVIIGKTRSVPLNILSSVYGLHTVKQYSRFGRTSVKYAEALVP